MTEDKTIVINEEYCDVWRNPNKNPDGSWMGQLWPTFTEVSRRGGRGQRGRAERPQAEEYAELTINRTRAGNGPRRRQCAFWRHYVPALYTATCQPLFSPNTINTASWQTNTTKPLISDFKSI